MNSNIKTRALIGTSIASVVLLYGNIFLAGLIVGLLKTDEAEDDSKAVLDTMNPSL